MLALFTVATTLTGYAVFQRYKEGVTNDRQQELAVIAESKSRQVGNWMRHRRGDVQAFRNDPLFLGAVEHWLQQGSPAGAARTKLLERMVAQQQASADYGYSSVSLFDDRAALRLSTSASEAPIQGMEKVSLLESMHSGQVTFSDIHREKRGSGELVEIELRVPLSTGRNGKVHSIGALLFRIDPYRFIFPLIQSWPTPSPSAETLLVRRDGDEVVFLNELRYRKNSPLTMHFPLEQSQLLATKAVMGQEGLAEGVDYRGVPVLGVINRIAGTSWFVISKMDKAEIYGPVNRLAEWIAGLMLVLVGGGGMVVFFWRQQEQRQYESKLERQMLSSHLNYLAKYANDIILLLDDAGNLTDFNDRAIEAFGYSAEELSGMHLDHLRAIDFSRSPAERFKLIDEAGGALIFESMMARRSGANFPVEVSVRRIDVGGRKFYQAILRDITERKQAENELARQRKFIRQVIDSNPSFIFVKDAGGRMLLANEAIAKSYGQTTEEIIGKANSDLPINPELAAVYDGVNHEVLETGQERMAVEMAILPDGKERWFHTIRKPLVQDDGAMSVLTIAMDVTELKEAEQEQQRLNRALRLLSLCNAALVHAEDEGELLVEICRLIVKAGGYRMAWVGLAEHDQKKNVHPAAQYGSDDGYLEIAKISWADTELGHGPTGLAIKTGITQINHDFLSNPKMAPWREAALARGFRSNISMCLASGAEKFGALTIYAAETHAFNAAEVKLLEELAGDLAFGMAALRTRNEHEQAIEKLRQSEEHFRFLTENASDVIYLMSLPDGRYNYLSPSSIRLTGYAPEEFYNSPMLTRAIIHPDSLAYCEEQWERLMQGEVPAYFEFRIIHKNGETRWMQQRNAPVWKEGVSKTLIAIQGVVTDVTEQKQAAEQLQFSNALLTTAYETSIDGILVVDANGQMISFNRQFIRMWGIPDEVIESRSDEQAMKSMLDKIVDPEKFLKKIWHLYVHTHEKSRDEISLLDGRVYERYTAPLVGAEGKYFGRAWYFRDITERKQAEERLQQQKTFLHQIIDTDPSLIYVKDADGKFTMVNRALANFYGLSVRQMIGKSDAMISLGRKGLSGYLEPDVESFRDGQDVMLAESSLTVDGKQNWYLTIKKPLPQPDGSFNVLGIAVDITGQKLSEMKLAESYKELQRLTAHLENVREEERTRIARELHDEMGATLAALKMRAAWLASKLPPGFPLFKEEVEHISGLVSEGIATVRQVVGKLRPSLLEDIGLDAAIENYVGRFTENSDIECMLVLPEDGIALETEQSAAIFRILQESLSNVAKHAQASKVDIRLTRQADSLLMVVEDNGLGFAHEYGGKSFGLLGIRERAMMVGGNARISSTPGKGTRVLVSIPVPYSKRSPQQFAVS